MHVKGTTTWVQVVQEIGTQRPPVVLERSTTASAVDRSGIEMKKGEKLKSNAPSNCSYGILLVFVVQTD